ncbi:hypothetical protein LCGC14_2186330 [marine sediment metagenome]|uniref:Uncharacterized protein n=1 Tax=marine sediment metagenome TaxID=412755 RepID=A0A0F9DL44_9ZZZZ
MESRLCPVCRKGKVWRRQVRTCSTYCSRTWNTWSVDIQASAVESAMSTTITPISETATNEELSKGKPEFLK